VCFAPDGRYALSGGLYGLQLWEGFYPETRWEEGWHPYPLLCQAKTTAGLELARKEASDLLQAAREFLEKDALLEAYRLLRESQAIPGYEQNSDVRALLTVCGMRGK